MTMGMNPMDFRDENRVGWKKSDQITSCRFVWSTGLEVL